jgi:hypothetical protein
VSFFRFRRFGSFCGAVGWVNLAVCDVELVFGGFTAGR